jgi:hypothetical protein
MVKQYPHILKLTITTPASQDGSGNWVPGSTSNVEVSCRFETNAGDAFVKLDQGETVKYDGIVYMPLSDVNIAPGTSVEVLNGAEVLSKGTVKRFSKGQLNARVWL